MMVAEGVYGYLKMRIDEMTLSKKKVLFLSNGNSCRSQMAEAMVNHFLGGQWHAFCAGTRPTRKAHPQAIAALKEIGIDHLGKSKSVDRFRGEIFDLVITVCDDTSEDGPFWFGEGRRVRLSLPDPSLTAGSVTEKMKIFRQVRDDMRLWVLALLH